MILTLPRIFWEDHYERCADHDGERNILKVARNVVTVELDDEAFADLKSDAGLYATPYQFDYNDYGSLIRSAERTLVAIKRQQGTRR